MNKNLSFSAALSAVKAGDREIINIKKQTGVHHFTTREYFST